ncbi:helix-turn-helix domain-containing protein [Actinoplanes sp. HUAS TT8]|uniref:helix-turn-helix domain-containing protein n=1 Tax=Actinoplanes sp. HUAS TT8 TaxID=3447453 RepID=UPI003F5260EE
MNAPPQWAANTAVQQAVQAHDYAAILRFSRIAAGLTLEQLGAAGGYSASTLSRLESGRRAIRDVTELRALADLYDVPAQMLGLATPPRPVGGSNLTTTVDGEGDTVQRRNFLAGAAALGATAALPATLAEAAPSGNTIEDVLFGRLTAEPLSHQQLAAQIAAARADYRATRYTRLARRLPKLLAQASAGSRTTGLDGQAAAAQQLAEAYGVATQLLIKLYDNGLACVTADRAVQAARTGNDPLILAESQRLAATVLRRADHGDSAQALVFEAAAQLRSLASDTTAAYHAMYGQLLAGPPTPPRPATTETRHGPCWPRPHNPRTPPERRLASIPPNSRFIASASRAHSATTVPLSTTPAKSTHAPLPILNAASATGRTLPWRSTAAEGRPPRSRRCWPLNATPLKKCVTVHGRNASLTICSRPRPAAVFPAYASSPPVSVSSEVVVTDVASSRTHNGIS